uniref:Phospholipase A2 n=1 Tax=Phallusia mammillata TaxID=59560 RepID=A0A6F9DPF8_9ASCI|nr:cytosolic phospholipase A2 [Phallusia mammillata]
MSVRVFKFPQAEGEELEHAETRQLSRHNAIVKRGTSAQPSEAPAVGIADTGTKLGSLRIEAEQRGVLKNAGDKPDPFQFFEVEHAPCHVLKVRVLCGRNISKGRFGDILDTPDPYVLIHIREAPDGRKRTKHIDNEPNPKWDEQLTYFLPPCLDKHIVADIRLMDANYSIDEQMGSVEFDVGPIPLEQTVSKTFSFNETSEVDIEFRKESKYESDIRYSLALCPEEKEFRSARKRSVCEALRRVMVAGPRTVRETPTIAIVGSGGGFRAVTGYSGAIKALHDMGIFDCATYVAGLSGSSWYLATLYAHDQYPKVGPEIINEEIRKNIQSSPFWLLRPECLMRYSHRLRAKMKSGQPVTFTDFFGLLIGQTLLGSDKMETATLSQFGDKIKNGKLPMPLMTCLHVRPNVSAMTFHDWIEFSPYEIGMAKYGAFMKTKYFGSKFYMGVVAREFEESPLHFLMGIWGSAFSILFNRLVEKSKGLGKADNKNEDFRQELEKELDETLKNQLNMPEEDSEEEYSEDDEEYSDAAQELPNEAKQTEKRPSIIGSWFGVGGGASASSDPPEEEAEEKKQKGFFGSLVSNMFGSHFMESRDNRAGKILNYMRGLSLNRTYPLSPFTPLVKSTIAEDGEFVKIHEPMEVRRKKVHLVDSGLTFNSPYPAILRPQRAVDLILSFDFSGRPTDNHEPFKEILLAEKWAHMHHLPFPKIDRSIFEENGMKECYVFKDESDDRAPTIIHFVLCNEQFKKFSAPGVPRKPGDNRADFSIFDQPKTPYSTFNFQYSNEAFDRLNKLMEFNTLLHKETILEEIQSCISLRRHSQTRCSITLNDIRNSFHMSVKNKQSLEKAIMTSGNIPLD